MIKKTSRNKNRLKRHLRIRGKISGTPERPRLCVFRSNKYIYAQLIDDINGTTLAAATTQNLKEILEKTNDTEAAKQVGKAIAASALEKGYESVVFDRNGYLYHGRVKEFAEAAREGGLKF
ncbi:MAG: 50S ribosomal protein L18 [Eubacteriaceae bacterium]|nr:50S ribosomal protein L18 [Eubacteriaceae bacterium]